MSAFVVDRDVISYLVSAAQSRRVLGAGSALSWHAKGVRHTLDFMDREGAAGVGQMLWSENIASVMHRYPDDSRGELPGPIGEDFVYSEHLRYTRPIDPVQVLKACHCFCYQSCEHEDWEESSAHAFVLALIHRACSALPGYEEAEWGAPVDFSQQAQ